MKIGALNGFSVGSVVCLLSLTGCMRTTSIQAVLQKSNSNKSNITSPPIRVPTSYPSSKPSSRPSSSPSPAPSPIPPPSPSPQPSPSPSPTPTIANPYACNPSQGPGFTDFRRLNRREYVSVLAQLFPAISPSQYLNALETVPVDSITNLQVFDTQDSSVSAPHIQGYMLAAEKIANVVTTTPTELAKVLNNCSTTSGMSTTCWNNFFNGIATQIYRRPLTAEEKTTYQTLYAAPCGSYGSCTHTLALGLKAVLQAMLQSPSFIYKLELGDSSSSATATTYNLTAWEAASRLAFLATGQGPDAQLLADAQSGTLLTATGWKNAVNRLFATPAAKTQIQSFYLQWLGLRNIPRGALPSWVTQNVNSTALPDESLKEMDDFMKYYIWTAKGTYSDIMTSEMSFLSTQSNLALVYNAPIGGNLPTGQRHGVLSRAAGLLSQGSRPSTIHRGVIIRRNILCTPLPPPPIVDGKAPSVPPPIANQTTARQIANLTKEPNCMICHNKINGLGFMLESYDAIGRFRTQETIWNDNGNVLATLPLNPTTVSPNIDMNGDAPVSSMKELTHALATSKTGPQCFAKQWFVFTTGRTSKDVEDACIMSGLFDALMNPKTVSSSGDQSATLLNMLKQMTFDPNFKIRKKGL